MSEAISSLMKNEFEKAYQKGLELGRIAMIVELFTDGLLSVKDAARKLDMSEEAFREKYKK